MFTGTEGPWGGFTQLTEDDGRRPQWIPYVLVTDLDAAVGRATKLGATVVKSRVDLPQGSVAVIEDSTRATVALWEPKQTSRP
jgi:predicted enzyme related to lactoylglutathione lyase